MKMFKQYPYMEEEPGAEGGEGGGGAAPEPVNGGKWYESLPEDMRGDQNITKFDSVESMAKSWLNAQRLIGQDKIPVPQTDEDWDNVYSRLGRPEDPTGYKIEAPEGLEVNADIQGAFLETAHKLGLNQAQVEGLAQWQFEQSINGEESSKAASESALNEKMESLKKEWGQAFDQNASIAQRAVNEFASDADRDFLNNAVIDGVKAGNHPVLARLFHNIGKQMMESGKLEGKGAEGVLTPKELEDQTTKLMNHPAYTNRQHPEHKMVMRQVQELFEKRFG